MGGGQVGDPVAECFINGVLQGTGPGVDRDDLISMSGADVETEVKGPCRLAFRFEIHSELVFGHLLTPCISRIPCQT